MATLEKAIEIAARAHSSQVDKAGEPYILHPLRVMLNVAGLQARIAAALHDVVEDSPMTLEELRREGFADEALEAIDALTRREGETRMQAAIRAAANPIARAVKIADVIDNMNLSRIEEPSDRDIARLNEYKAVLAMLTAKTSRVAEADRQNEVANGLHLKLVEVRGDTDVHVRVEITKEGDLLFSGQDLGDAPQKFWGEDEYEYWLLVAAADKDCVLLALIEKLYAGNATVVSEFMEFLDSKGIPRAFNSWV